MTSNEQDPAPERQSTESSNSIEPLEGEVGIPSVTQPRLVKVSRKGVFAIAFLCASLLAVSGVSIYRALASNKADDETSKRLGDRPTAAAAEPRRLDMSLPTPTPAPASVASASARMIPEILPIPGDKRPEPIPVRRTEPQRLLPEDAPAVLVSSRPNAGAPPAPSSNGTSIRSNQASAEAAPSATADPLDDTRRNLDAYQQQLRGLLGKLTKSTDTATETSVASAPLIPQSGAHVSPIAQGTKASGGGLFGGQLPSSATPSASAGLLGSRSLTLPKGTAFTCALKTRIVSAASGFVSCQVQRNVFSDDGRVLLIERGSHMDGEYRITSVKPGTVRIPVLWTRIRTPNGVTVDIDSPGTGQLGEAGIDGYVDNRWLDRIGAAMLLSVINDSVKLVVQHQSSDSQGDTIVLPSTTANTNKLAEKVLDSTINIPPLIYQNQGAIVGIYVARDVDFSSVYELKAVER